jgi:hypothetical protein
MATRNIMSVLPWWNPAAALDRAFHGMPRAIAFNGLKPRNDARSRQASLAARDSGGGCNKPPMSVSRRHCEEPTGPREARGPMTGSAMKPSSSGISDRIASLCNDQN